MRGRLRRLVPARFDRGTLRAAGFVVLLAVVFTVVDTQVAAAADGTSGGGTGLLAPLNLTTSEGAPLEGYRMGSNPGVVLNVADNARAFLLSGLFAAVRLLVGLAGWLVEFVFSFPLLGLLLGPAQELADTYKRLVVDTLGLKGLLLGWAFIFGLILFMRGKTARGLGEILLTLIIAAFAASALIRPDYLLAKDGPLDQVHQAAAEVAATTVNSYDFDTHGEEPCTGLPGAAVAACEQRQGAKADPDKVSVKGIAKPLQDVLTNALIVKPYMLLQYGQILDPAKDAKAYAVHLKWINGAYTPGSAAQGEQKKKAEDVCDVVDGPAHDYCVAGNGGPPVNPPTADDELGPGAVMEYLSPESREFNAFTEELGKAGETGAKAAAYAKNSSWERVGAVLALLIAVVLVAAMIVAMVLVMLGTQAAEVCASAVGGVALVWGMLPGPSRSAVWKWLMIFMASTLLMFAVAAFIPFFGIAVDVVLVSGPDLLLERLLLVDAVAVLGLAFHRRLLASATGFADRLQTQMRFSKVGGSHLAGDSTEFGAALATYAAGGGTGGGVSSGMLLVGGKGGFRAGLLGTRQRLMSRLAALSDGTGMPVNGGGILRDAGAEARRGLAPGMIAAAGGALAVRGAYSLLVGSRPGDDQLAKWRVPTDPKLPPGEQDEASVSGPHGTGPNGPQSPGGGKNGPQRGPHAPVRIRENGEVLHDPATDRPLLGVRAHNRLVRLRGYRVARRAGLTGYRATYGLAATVDRANQARSDLWADAKQQVTVAKAQLGEDGRQWEPVGRPLKAAGQATHQAAVNTAVAGAILSAPARRPSSTAPGSSPTPVSRAAEGASYTRQRVNDALFEAQREDWEARRAEEGRGGAPLKARPRPQPAPEPVLDPAEATPLSPQDGPCARCHRTTRKYGIGGNPLCGTCRAAAARPTPPPTSEPRRRPQPEPEPGGGDPVNWTWDAWDVGLDGGDGE
ncbi:hypothetical protein [Streptomyces sp. NPDC051561]|uniref:hypothetical protein n=1 Tax=Streptomyces sp. NPDC051561 TaxID=3365658 RepID=UPI0037B15E6E